MAYSAIEQRYVDLLITAAFPDAVSEPDPMAEEPSLEGMQLAAGPSNTRTDAGPRYGRGGVTKAQSEAAGGFERPLTALADVTAGGARGGVVQAAGLGGDLEMIYNGLKSVFNRPEDQSRIDAFLAGMAVKTGMATSEQVSKEGFRIPLTDIQVKLPPVVPEGAADAKSRQVSANVGQAFGELAPLPGAIDAGIAGTKAIAKGVKELAPKAGEMLDSYLTKTGAVLKVAPDAPAIEVPAAPKLNTPAFKKWFGDSKVVDNKGQPMVMYHGTKHVFEQFDPNIGYQGAMFFSPKREFAENYMAGTDVREPIAVYLSAKNPFDYDNPKHREAVIELAIENTPLYKTAKDPKEMRRVLNEAITNKDANWTTLEEKGFQDAIKKLGFDSFYVKESGVKNIAVYDPTQIKSVFNKGTFDPKDPRILHGGGAVATGAATQGEEKK